jgi:hypothetical protein
VQYVVVLVRSSPTRAEMLIVWIHNRLPV